MPRVEKAANTQKPTLRSYQVQQGDVRQSVRGNSKARF